MKPNANNHVNCDSDNRVQKKRNLFHVILRFVIPLTMLVCGIYVHQTNSSFIRNSRLISAELTSSPVKQTKINRNPEGGDSSQAIYWVDYSFSVDGKTYTGHGSINSAPIGPRVHVYYKVGNPANNRTDVPGRDEGVIWICLALLLGVLMCPQFWRGPTQV